MTRSIIFSFFLLSALLSLVSAFTVPRSHQNTPFLATSTATFMTKNIEADTKLVVTGNNIELTPALKDYVDKRIGGLLEKLGGGGIVRECDVHLSVCKNPSVSDCLLCVVFMLL